MTNEAIIQEIRNNPTNKNELLQILFEQNQTLIRQSIKPYLPYIEYADAMQQAFLSIYDAIEVYDEDKGLFMTIYPYYIKRDITRLLEKSTAARVPNYMRAQIREAEKIKSEYMEATGTAPNSKYIANVMGITMEQLKEIWKAKRVISSVSLNAPVKDTEEDNLTLQDTIPGTENEEADIIERVYQEQLNKDIWEAVAECKPKDRQAIELYYKDNMTYKEAGEIMNMSIDGVRQHINSALRSLRSGKNKKKLEHYLDLYIHIAYKGSVSTWKRTDTSSTEYVALKLYEAEERTEKQQPVEVCQEVIDEVKSIMQLKGWSMAEEEIAKYLNYKVV